MKLKLWIATQDKDSSCYNLIAKTKKELLEKIKEYSHIQYEEIAQVEASFRDAFDMFDWVTSENGGRASSILKYSNRLKYLLFSYRSTRGGNVRQ